MIYINIKKSSTEEKCHIYVKTDASKYTTISDSHKIIRALIKMFPDQDYKIDDEILKSKLEVIK